MTPFLALNMNRDTEILLKIALYFQVTQLKDKMLPHKLPDIPWDCSVADNFTINDKCHLCIVDCHSTFPVTKHVGGLSADNLIKHVRLSLQNMKLPVS